MPRFPNIPGVDLIVVDGQLVAVTERPPTESVLIIGPALDGPTDRPLRLANQAVIETVYGPVSFNNDYSGPNGETTGYSGNALVKALREVQSGGAADIRLLRVGGTSASGTFNMPANLNAGATGTIILEAKFPGRIYNKVTVVFASGATSGSVTITQPVSKGGDITISWSAAAGTSGQTIAEVIDRINAHPSNSTVKASIGTISGTAQARLLIGTGTLAGGTDGTIKDDLASNKTALYNNLTAADVGTFAILDDYEVDVIYLAGVYADDLVVSGDNTKSVMQPFAEFLGKRTQDHPIIGVVGTKPLDDFSTRAKIKNHVDTLLTKIAGTRGTNWINCGYFLHNGFTFNDGTLEQPIDAGAYLQVVAADCIFNDAQLGLYVETGAGVYAGTIAALKPHQPTTHKPVNGIFGVPYEFTRAQLDRLSAGVGNDALTETLGGGAYVTIRRIEGRGFMFTRGVTAAQRKSDYKDLQPLRIASAVHKGVKEIAFPFLGQTNDFAHRQALTTAIKTFLDGMYDAGALLGKEGVGYKVTVLGGQTPLQNLLGRLDIEITLRPALEIKNISVRVKLSL